MKLGEIARVARGIVTGDRALFVMSREAAKELNLEQFARPILRRVTELPRYGIPVVYDIPSREVVIIASAHDVETNSALKAYLGEAVPRVATAKGPPIVATYVGIPRFVANPDGLVVTNSFYTVTPRQPMSAKEIASLVERLNAAAIKAAPQGKKYAERHTPRQMETLEI